jgi:hypothetical protein
LEALRKKDVSVDAFEVEWKKAEHVAAILREENEVDEDVEITCRTP